MSAETSLKEFAESISDMVETARQAKGERFITAATAIFECMQAAKLIDAVASQAATSTGATYAEGARISVLSASARIATLLDGDDAKQAVQLAWRMLERRDRVERAIAASRQEG